MSLIRPLTTAIGVGGLLAGVLVSPAVGRTTTGIPDAAIAETGVLTSRDDSPVAPGVNYTSFERLDAKGWQRGDILDTDLDKHGVTVDLVNNGGKVSGGQPLSQQLARKGAIAGVNGDFFDINDTTAPLGVGVEQSGKLLNAPAAGHNDTAVIGKDGLGKIAQLFLQGTATDDDATKLELTNLNSPTVNAGGIGLYTPEWGDAARTRTVDGLPTVREVILRDGVVVSSATTPATTPLAANEQALIGREAGADALTAFEVGDKVERRVRAAPGRGRRRGRDQRQLPAREGRQGAGHGAGRRPRTAHRDRLRRRRQPDDPAHRRRPGHRLAGSVAEGNGSADDQSRG